MTNLTGYAWVRHDIKLEGHTSCHCGNIRQGELVMVTHTLSGISTFDRFGFGGDGDEYWTSVENLMFVDLKMPEVSGDD